MVQQEKDTTEYTRVQIKIEGLPYIYLDGFSITDKQKKKMEYHAGSYNAFQRTPQDREISWKMKNPRDHASLHELYRRCREEGYTFTIIVLGENLQGGWDILDTLLGCDFPGGDREFGGKEAIKLTVEGTAFDRIEKAAEFA